MSNDKTAKQTERNKLEEKKRENYRDSIQIQRKNNELTSSLNPTVDVAHICVMWQMNSWSTRTSRGSVCENNLCSDVSAYLSVYSTNESPLSETKSCFLH